MTIARGALVSVLALLAVLATGRPSLAEDHPDTILNYFTCDGSAWSARWSGDGFMHTQRDTGASHPDTVLHYQTWDRSCWELRWDAGRAAFYHRPLTSGGAGHFDHIVNYLDWGGGRWTAFRTRDGWYHIQR